MYLYLVTTNYYEIRFNVKYVLTESRIPRIKILMKPITGGKTAEKLKDLYFSKRILYSWINEALNEDSNETFLHKVYNTYKNTIYYVHLSYISICLLTSS